MKERYRRDKQPWLIRTGKRLRDPVNAWFAQRSLIGDSPIIDAAILPQLSELQANWEVIRDEAAALLVDREGIPAFGKISPDHRRIATTSSWKSFFFEGYGFRSEANRAKCPRTARMLDQIPGLVVAFFSIMEPNTHVPRHRGLTKAWLNCHLAVSVPKGPERCEMMIGDETVRWEDGRWMVFDETVPHEVWNDSNEIRVVLFLQVRRPMSAFGNLAASLLFNIIRRTRFVRDVRKAIAAANAAA